MPGPTALMMPEFPEDPLYFKLEWRIRVHMGGYGHSRLRELALGGVTREVLASMTMPVLMSH